MKPNEGSQKGIDELLPQAAWLVQDRGEAKITTRRGLAIRELPLKSGCGFAEYRRYIDGTAAGVVEAKKEGNTGSKRQLFKYSQGLPDNLPVGRPPLPFCYEGASLATRFTNLLGGDAGSRRVFSPLWNAIRVWMGPVLLNE